MPKKPQSSELNPYLKKTPPEKAPCVHCMLHKPVHNNITAQIDDKLHKKKTNNNNLKTKDMFGSDKKKKTKNKPKKKSVIY